MRRRLDRDEEAGHEFDAINTLLLVVVLGLCILASYLIKKYRFYYVPESAATLLVGLLVGKVAKWITGNAQELNFLSFQPELFFFLLLPPIIFEAGYTLRRKHFFRNLGTIISYAVVGTLISTFIVGYLTFTIGRAGLIDIDTQNPMEALLFGADTKPPTGIRRRGSSVVGVPRRRRALAAVVASAVCAPCHAALPRPAPPSLVAAARAASNSSLF
jgi:sodium/hydrogen exchanger 8